MSRFARATPVGVLSYLNQSSIFVAIGNLFKVRTHQAAAPPEEDRDILSNIPEERQKKESGSEPGHFNLRTRKLILCFLNVTFCTMLQTKELRGVRAVI